jgi:GTP cyclohydrolase I
MQLSDWLKKVTTSEKAIASVRGDVCEARIVRAYRELLSGYDQDPSTILKTTHAVEDLHQGAVTVRDISFYSLCSHHFLPFFGKITITYAPGDRIVGLGKFPRLVDAYARRFQIQEDLVREIAEEIMRSGGARGVRVEATARHLCMCSRGPSDDTVETVTTYGLGTLAEKL